MHSTETIRGVVGDIAHPFRTAQTTYARGDFAAGDFVVLRGGTWTDTYSRYDSFFSFCDGKGGTATNPIALMGYPGEVVNVSRPNNAGHGIHAWSVPGGFVVANLHINMNTGSTCIGWPPGASSSGNTMQNVRIVNNELYGMDEDGGGSACIEGRGQHIKVIGNYVHDNSGNGLYHGVYFDNNDGTGTSDLEIAYNRVANQKGGRGIQIYNSGTSGIDNVSVHHNLVHDIALDGILFGDSTGAGCDAYNNVVYRTGVPALQVDKTGAGCIRFNNPSLVARAFNNTFADCGIDNDGDSGGIRFEAANRVTLTNNIVLGKYWVNFGSLPTTLVATNNLWSGGGAAPSWDTNSVTTAPTFVDAANRDYHLLGASSGIDVGAATVSSLVADDFDGDPRPLGAGYDIGAYEFARTCNQASDCDAPPPCRVTAGATCNAGSCMYPAAANGMACTDDSNACTIDTCQAGTCAHTPDPACASADAGPGADGGGTHADAGVSDCCGVGPGPGADGGGTHPDAGISNGVGPGDGGTGSQGNGAAAQDGSDSGCTCSTRGARGSKDAGAFAALALVGVALVRRRRSLRADDPPRLGAICH